MRAPMTTLEDLIKSGASQPRIADHLDALSNEERTAQATSLTRGAQPALFDLADPEITLDHFAPEGGTLHPVIHMGQNNQPAFRSFSKPCTRGLDGTIFGFNEGLLRPVIGPRLFRAPRDGRRPARPLRRRLLP